MPFFPERLDSVASLRGRYEQLAPDESQEAWNAMWKVPADPELAAVDIGPLSQTDVQAALRSLGVPEATYVTLAWVDERDVAIRMSWGTFVDHHDDFWYPSSDDIRLMSLDAAWLVQIDHEELVTLLHRPK